MTTSTLDHPGKRPCCKGLFATVLAGTGFMMDAYDLFVVNTVVLILKSLYEHDTSDETAVATSAVAGSVCGQMLFGLVADRIGRKRGFIITLMLVLVGALLSSMAVNSAALSVFVLIAIFRFILGIGIGGEYPLSATITSENSASKHNRGKEVAMVFSMQGIGMLLAPLMGVILLSIFPTHLDVVWRMLVGITGVPGIIMMYWRCKMKETKAFSRSKARRVSQWTLIRRSWRKLVGTAGCWFLFDVTFYANGLFSSVIIHDTGFSVGDSKHDAIKSATELNLILVFIALPGYYAAVFLIDRIGRRKLQMGGFIGMAVTYLIMGIFMKPLEEHIGLFFFVYGLSFFFSNCGPNTTTFVLPSEVFPTEIRATCHGLSAAAGKLGAFVGGAMIRPIMNAYGLGAAMVIFGFIALAGLVVTYFFVEETLGKSLDEMGSGVSHPGDSDERTVALAVLSRDANAASAHANDYYRASSEDDAGAASGARPGISLDAAAVLASATPASLATTPAQRAPLVSPSAVYAGSATGARLDGASDDDDDLVGPDGHEVL